LSHWSKDHVDGYGQQSVANTIPYSTITENSDPNPAANLSRFVHDPYSNVPTVPPELTVNEASVQCELLLI